MNTIQTNPVLRCVDIHKEFLIDKKSNATLNVLRGINLTVSKGEIIAIVGASGSGKSTLLHILGGLDLPTSGEVWWGEKNIGQLSDENRSRLRGTDIGFVFQFHHLLPEFTALENVMIPILIQNGSMEDAAVRSKELLVKVGLADRMNHKPAELSGGEQQRVAVARALANRPGIILADEPSGNLDSEGSEKLHSLLWDLNRTEGQTFIIVTHNESLASQSSRRLLMRDGLLVHHS